MPGEADSSEGTLLSGARSMGYPLYQQRITAVQHRHRHPRGGTVRENDVSPGADMKLECSKRVQIEPSGSEIIRDEFSPNDSSSILHPRAARDRPGVRRPRDPRGHASAAAAAPGDAHGGLEREVHGGTDAAANAGAIPKVEYAADIGYWTWAAADHEDATARQRRTPGDGDRSGKRRRLRGKQPPSDGAAEMSSSTTIVKGITDDSREQPGRSAWNSVHEGISACPSRSTTSSLDRSAPADRDGHVLETRLAAHSAIRAGGLAQHGAGLVERTRGRGRPPEV